MAVERRCLNCGSIISAPDRMTNADRIRGMTDKELAEWISCNCAGDGYGNSEDEWLDWLKQEVSE